jgi:hypothetical protein
MHLITHRNQMRVFLLSDRLTGRYPVAIVQGSSLSHPTLVRLPAYRRVAVFARICGTRPRYRHTERVMRPEARSHSVPPIRSPVPPIGSAPGRGARSAIDRASTNITRPSANAVHTSANGTHTRTRPISTSVRSIRAPNRSLGAPAESPGPPARTLGVPTGATPPPVDATPTPAAAAHTSAEAACTPVRPRYRLDYLYPMVHFVPILAFDCVRQAPWGCLTCRYATRRLPAE